MRTDPVGQEQIREPGLCKLVQKRMFLTGAPDNQTVYFIPFEKIQMFFRFDEFRTSEERQGAVAACEELTANSKKRLGKIVVVRHLAGSLEETDHSGLTRKEAQGVNARLVIQLMADFQNPLSGFLADGDVRFASGKNAGNGGRRAFRKLCNPADVERFIHQFCRS